MSSMIADCKLSAVNGDAELTKHWILALEPLIQTGSVVPLHSDSVHDPCTTRPSDTVVSACRSMPCLSICASGCSLSCDFILLLVVTFADVFLLMISVLVIIYIHHVQKKRCHLLFCYNFYKY